MIDTKLVVPNTIVPSALNAALSHQIRAWQDIPLMEALSITNSHCEDLKNPLSTLRFESGKITLAKKLSYVEPGAGEQIIKVVKFGIFKTQEKENAIKSDIILVVVSSAMSEQKLTYMNDFESTNEMYMRLKRYFEQPKKGANRSS